MESVEKILSVTPGEPGVWEGIASGTQQKRTFGGQVVGQSLAAAIAALREESEDKVVDSLHGYFVSGGDAAEGMSVEVTPVRRGRSYTNLAVRAAQGERALFVGNVNFRRPGDPGPTHSVPMPQVPPPEGLSDGREYLPQKNLLLFAEWEDWEFRMVENHAAEGYGHQRLWFRASRPLPDDPDFHAAALAYMTDMTILYGAMAPHRNHPVQMASLDHAVWFHHPVRVDQWLLYDQVSPSASEGRALCTGRIYTQDGQLVASVAQEGLTRTLKKS
ncbi:MULTISPECIES: acyl-CoA thioesterase [unclassified Corynebacterium]|uniref:acyl-CoA thioesterase n=1 Tax=unclassified Corynebacterium TaxID=2624378 RepID=UPI0029C9EF3B|nr:MULTISPECIES: acyl-CoA thioesterase domain-containing protein [unclassified Corynebacterium]WPF65205.1 thioesterase family protein [Corynebacterium sp. 22KM0430]WPF67700.1 thioesterase family protein [Corynebacterium sp. 21KM1197]